MNRLARAQGMSNDPVKLCAVIDINLQRRQRRRQVKALPGLHQLRQYLILTEQGALHQNAVGHLGAMEEFIRLRQHRQPVVHRMGGGDPGVAFPQPANHPAAGDNCIHHIAKRLGQLAAALVRQRR